MKPQTPQMNSFLIVVIFLVNALAEFTHAQSATLTCYANTQNSTNVSSPLFYVVNATSADVSCSSYTYNCNTPDPFCSTDEIAARAPKNVYSVMKTIDCTTLQLNVANYTLLYGVSGTPVSGIRNIRCCAVNRCNAPTGVVFDNLAYVAYPSSGLQFKASKNFITSCIMLVNILFWLGI